MTYERDPNQIIPTVAEMADHFCAERDSGKAAWSAGLCLRGISMIRVNGRGPSLCVLPDDQRYDEQRQIVFLGARDS